MCECWVPRGLQYLPETRECWEGLGGGRRDKFVPLTPTYLKRFTDEL